MASQHPDIEKVLFTQEDIDGIVSRLGEQIKLDNLQGKIVIFTEEKTVENGRTPEGRGVPLPGSPCTDAEFRLEIRA